MQISYISKTSKFDIKNLFIFFVLWFCIVILLIFSKTNFKILKDTLDLYIYTVLPAIFPFLFLTNILIEKNLIDYLIIGKNTLICRLLKISKCSIPVLIIGSIFGYPNSINYATHLLNNNYISKKEYEKLLIICNNPSLIYILSSIGIGIFNNINIGIILFLTITLTNILICICYRPDINIIQQTSIKSNSFYKKEASFFEVILTSLKHSFQSLLFILGFMLLFVLLASILTNILHLNIRYSSVLFGLLEISTGIKMIATNFSNIYTILYLVCFMLSFSSLMVILQLFSFAKEKISLTKLIYYKLIQAISSCTLLYFLKQYINLNEYIYTFSSINLPTKLIISTDYIIYLLLIIFFILIYIKSSWQKRQLQKGDNV